MDEHGIREEHIKLTTLKMDYDILKTSKLDELDNWNKSFLRESDDEYRRLSRQVEMYGQTHIRKMQSKLFQIEMVLEDIDRKIESNLRKMPIHLEVEIELSLQEHLRNFMRMNRHKSQNSTTP